jgi:hypothetical protein
MERSLRNLERQAATGDPEAEQALARLRARSRWCTLHGGACEATNGKRRSVEDLLTLIRDPFSATFCVDSMNWRLQPMSVALAGTLGSEQRAAREVTRALELEMPTPSVRRICDGSARLRGMWYRAAPIPRPQLVPLTVSLNYTTQGPKKLVEFALDCVSHALSGMVPRTVEAELIPLLEEARQARRSSCVSTLLWMDLLEVAGGPKCRSPGGLGAWATVSAVRAISERSREPLLLAMVHSAVMWARRSTGKAQSNEARWQRDRFARILLGEGVGCPYNHSAECV